MEDRRVVDQLVGESDQAFMRRYWTVRIAEDGEYARAHRNDVVMTASTAATFFWDEQTSDERQRTKEFLVRNGLASWAIPR